MTSVIGHLTGLDFEPEFRNWHSCQPARLFDAPVIDSVANVSFLLHLIICPVGSLICFRINEALPIISKPKQDILRPYLYGPIVIEKENILAWKYESKPNQVIRELKSEGRGSVILSERKSLYTHLYVRLNLLTEAV